MDIEEFSENVGTIVEEQYGYTDGDDLCFNLIKQGVINPAAGEMSAARIVAQHIGQA